MKSILLTLALLMASPVQAQVVVVPAAPVFQPAIVPVMQPVQLQLWWVPRQTLLGRTTWTAQWVAVPVQPTQPPRPAP